MPDTVTPTLLREAAIKKRDGIIAQFPTLGFVSNKGQERFLKKYDKPLLPYIGVFSGGNGTGKTTLLANILAALCFGPELMGPWMEHFGLCKEMHARVHRRGTKLQIRILCHGDSMKETGSVCESIKEWFPKGRYQLDKGGKQFYSKIQIFDSQWVDSIDIKSFDQSGNAVAGPTLDVQLVDEPPPEETFSEMVGRTRGKDGVGGVMLFFFTPLKIAGWMVDQVIDREDDSEIVLVRASLWENCKDIAGTRGHLSRESIERQIRQWERISPDEVDARVNGSTQHLSGSIFKIWTPDVHVVDPFPIPTYWPIYCIIDPHDTRYPAVIWVAAGEDRGVVFDEWPRHDYTKLGHSDMTIAMICNTLREIEMGYEGTVTYRFMDPNKGNTKNSMNNKTMQQCYSECGLPFQLVQTDDLQVGHSKVNELLYFDKKMEVGTGNRPWLQVFSHCKNTQHALHRYGVKRGIQPGQSLTSSIDPKYKDFADDVRYFAVSRRPFQRSDTLANFAKDLFSGRRH